MLTWDREPYIFQLVSEPDFSLARGHPLVADDRHQIREPSLYPKLVERGHPLDGSYDRDRAGPTQPGGNGVHRR